MIENTLKEDQKIKYFDLATRFDIGSGITIENRGNLTVPNADRWAIIRGSRYCYNNKSSKWEWEEMPSYRTDAFIVRTRYTLDKAFEIVNSPKFKKELE